MVTNVHLLTCQTIWQRIVSAAPLLLMLGTWSHFAVAQAPKHLRLGTEVIANKRSLVACGKLAGAEPS